MAVYGYARVSSPKQKIERQVRAIRQAYPEAVIVQEAASGTRMERKMWGRLFSAVCSGDTIVFDSVSRMSRTAEDGFSVYEALYGRGVRLVFLNEPHINTDTYTQVLARSVPMTGTSVDRILEGVNRYLLELAREQIRLAFEQAEQEVEDLHRRTREGIETARLNGKQIGQRQGAKLVTKKSIAAKEAIRRHAVCFGGSLSDRELMQLTGLSRNTFYKYKRELRWEAEEQEGP